MNYVRNPLFAIGALSFVAGIVFAETTTAPAGKAPLTSNDCTISDYATVFLSPKLQAHLDVDEAQREKFVRLRDKFELMLHNAANPTHVPRVTDTIIIGRARTALEMAGKEAREILTDKQDKDLQAMFEKGTLSEVKISVSRVVDRLRPGLGVFGLLRVTYTPFNETDDAGTAPAPQVATSAPATTMRSSAAKPGETLPVPAPIAATTEGGSNPFPLAVVPGEAPLANAIADKIRASIAGKTTQRIEPVGGGAGRFFFEDAPTDGAVLIGLRYCPGKWAGFDVIPFVQPIYLGRKGEFLGEPYGVPNDKVIDIKAKAGYAVGGIDIRGGAGLNAFALTFMKLTDAGKLDRSDSYKVEQVGGNNGGAARNTVSNGTLIIGINGRMGEKGGELGFAPVFQSEVPNEVGPWRTSDGPPAPKCAAPAPAALATTQPAPATAAPAVALKTVQILPVPAPIVPATQPGSNSFPLAEVPGETALPEALADKIKASVAGKTTEGIEPVGGAFGRLFFDDIPTDGAVLIGIRCCPSKWFNQEVVSFIQPIYLGRKGEFLGEPYGIPHNKVIDIKAKAGYAVGGMNIRGGGGLDAFALTFMKLTADGKLDPNDKYQVEKVGGNGGGERNTVSNGTLIVGINGKMDDKGANIGFAPVFQSEVPGDVGQWRRSVGPPAPKCVAPGPPPPLVPTPGVQPLAAALADKIQKAVNDKTIETPAAVGGGFGRSTFTDVPPDGATLIGLRYCTSKGNSEYISFIQPIYLGRKGEFVGEPHGVLGANMIEVRGKAGYAVGGMEIRGGGGLDAFQLTFMKFTDAGALDTSDSYKSDQCGGNGGAAFSAVSNGPAIVGITGKIDDSDGNLGLAPVFESTVLGGRFPRARMILPEQFQHQIQPQPPKPKLPSQDDRLIQKI